MSTFRVKLFVLWFVAFVAILVFESGLPALYRNVALGVFMILAIAQLYIRCETCESSFVTYFTDSKEEWKKSVSFYAAVLSDECPKCGARRI